MNAPRSVFRIAASALAGLVFGVGLAVAQMTNPDKVLDFLDITGTWDVSLLFVLGAATGLFAATYRFSRRWVSPVLDSEFHLPTLTAIDRRLVGGSVLFGIGWGIAGYCPGPAIASLGFGNPEALWVVPAIFVGIALERWLASKRLN
jgi:uncharacterized membrane protein YedE/YeeE